MGAEAPGYITVDRIGGARAAGGKCFVARDLARVGMMVANGGQRQGKQVIPKKWLNDIVQSGDPQAWVEGDFYDDMGPREMHYRSKSINFWAWNSWSVFIYRSIKTSIDCVVFKSE